MKTYKLFIAALFCAASLGGCKKADNINPNVPTTSGPQTILPQVDYSISGSLLASSFSLNNEMMQYTAMWQNIWQVQRSIFQISDFNITWGLYSNIRNLDEVIRLSKQNPNLENYAWLATITKCYIFSVLTDAYGDIPYSESGLAMTGVYGPKYDKQKDIYTDLLDKLKQANDSIDVAQGLILGGDKIFNGTMLNWKKFANSLRLKLLMRVSKKAEMNSGQAIREMLADPVKYPLINTNAESALYKYSGTGSDIFPYSSQIYADNQFKYYSASAFLVDSMKKFNDPRLAIYTRPISTSTPNNPVFVGLPSGLEIDQSNAYNGGPAYQSSLGTRFQKSTEAAIWMSYSEVLFLRTEAAMLGYSTEDPKTLYEQGIGASMAYWGATMPAGYLTQASVAFDGSLSKVFLQKYYALFFTGLEAWFEYRRTGYPAIIPGPANVNNGKVPVRLTYPLEEQSLNKGNYLKAIESIGGADDINTKVWWQQ